MANGGDLDKVLAALNAASAKARLTWVTLLLFGTYLAVAVGATTHRDLFLESPVTLPLLDVELPLFTFYIVAPALFVIMHLYLLVHLCLLGRKWLEFEDALRDLEKAERTRIRAQLDSFLVLQKLAGGVQGTVLRFLLNLTVWVTIIAGPVLLLLAFQVRFLAYHDEYVTLWHSILVLVDIVLLWLLWSLTRYPRARLLPTLVAPWSTFGTLARDLWSRGYWKTGSAPQATRTTAAIGSYLIGAFVLIFSFLVATVPDGYIEQRITGSGWFKLVDHHDGRRIWWPTAALFEGELDRARAELDSWFSRSLVLPDSDFIPMTEAELQEVERSLTFRDRDFRYAILNNADLRKVDIPNLKGANLSSSRLHSARFLCDGLYDDIPQQGRCPQMQRVDLSFATLQNVDLSWSELDGATFGYAKLQGANLSLTTLSGASLWNAQLQGVDLVMANLDGADLHDAQLDGASLRGASLIGTSLESADLRGASLDGASLHGASFKGAQLQGASLENAELWRADVREPARADLLSCRLASFAPLQASHLDNIEDGFEQFAPGNRIEPWLERIEVLRRSPEEVEEAERRISWHFTSCLDYDPNKSDGALASYLIEEVACNPNMIFEAGPVGTKAILGRMAYEQDNGGARPYHAFVARAVLKGEECAAVRENLSVEDKAAYQQLLNAAADEASANLQATGRSERALSPALLRLLDALYFDYPEGRAATPTKPSANETSTADRPAR